ncbi:hypothetical protein ACLBWZ_10540 [Brucellaceae bacterium C25G]
MMTMVDRLGLDLKSRAGLNIFSGEVKIQVQRPDWVMRCEGVTQQG